MYRETITLEQFKHHYYTMYPNSTIRLGQLFCLVCTDCSDDWQELYYCTDFYKTNELLWKFILDTNTPFDKIPLIRKDLL